LGKIGESISKVCTAINFDGENMITVFLDASNPGGNGVTQGGPQQWHGLSPPVLPSDDRPSRIGQAVM